MKVSDVMTKNVVSVRADEPLSNAAKLMWDCDCGAIPVIGEGDRVVSVITDRDICMATWFNNLPPSALRVSDAMSRSLYGTSPDDSLAYAEGLMRSKQIRRVPVIDAEQRLLGILSLADIVRQGSRAEGKRQSELGPEQITITLARIVEPPVGVQPGL